MKNYFCLVAIAALLLGFFSSCKETQPSADNDVTNDVTIVCVTSEASEITIESATLNGAVSFSNAKAEQADVWFLIGQEENNLAAKGKKISAGKAPTTGGPVSVSVNDLEPETTYYYMLCTSVDNQEANGKVESFTTLQEAKLAIVTADAENITETTAVLSGLIDGKQKEGVSFGIIYSSNENLERPDYLSSQELDANNKYTTTATDLFPATKYYYQAYLEQDGNIISMGEIKSFTTLDFSVTVSTEEVTDIDHFKATLHGSLTVQSVDPLNKAVWFLYSDKCSTIMELIGNCREEHLDLAEDGSFTLSLSSLKYNTTYYYVACTNVHYRDFYGEVKSFHTTAEPPAGAVDMGLSIYWAATNIGADNPEDYGGYFAWGEKETKDIYDWATYKMCNKVPATDDDLATFTKYVTNAEYGTVDSKEFLDPEDDVAHARLGGYWRMPTSNEWWELRDNCTCTWKQVNGVNGMLFTSNINGASIFFPAAGYRVGSVSSDVGRAGYYWSSQLHWRLSEYAEMWFLRSDKFNYYDDYRYFGYSVRPVFGE